MPYELDTSAAFSAAQSARKAQARLEAHGVTSYLDNLNASIWWGGASPWIHLQVPRASVPDALEILALRARPDELPEDLT
jgi:hypothetical protein